MINNIMPFEIKPPEPRSADPRVALSLEGVRFHSERDKEKCLEQVCEMLAIQLKSMAAAVDANHRIERRALENEIYLLQKQIRRQDKTQ